MFVIVVALLLMAVVWLVKNNTKRGAETVRAHVYLGLVRDGTDKLEANRAVMSVYDVDPDVVRSAKLSAARAYGGKQLAMIADAYRSGMLPNLAAGTVAKILTHHASRGAMENTSATTAGTISPVMTASSSAVNEARSGPADNDFQQYYEALLIALDRRSGPSNDFRREVELMVEMWGLEPLKDAFREGASVEQLADGLAKKLGTSRP